jgi:hypothetical protein
MCPAVLLFVVFTFLPLCCNVFRFLLILFGRYLLKKRGPAPAHRAMKYGEVQA